MQEEKEVVLNSEILKNLASARILKGDHVKKKHFEIINFFTFFSFFLEN